MAGATRSLSVPTGHLVRGRDGGARPANGSGSGPSSPSSGWWTADVRGARRGHSARRNGGSPALRDSPLVHRKPWAKSNENFGRSPERPGRYSVDGLGERVLPPHRARPCGGRGAGKERRTTSSGTRTTVGPAMDRSAARKRWRSATSRSARPSQAARGTCPQPHPEAPQVKGRPRSVTARAAYGTIVAHGRPLGVLAGGDATMATSLVGAASPVVGDGWLLSSRETSFRCSRLVVRSSF